MLSLVNWTTALENHIMKENITYEVYQMDHLSWRVEDYTTRDGESYVEAFLDQLPAKAAEKIMRDIELLERFGPRWGHPHVDYFKKHDLYELRIKHSSNIYRIFFFKDDETLLLLTHGFHKKSNKTPLREIQFAVKIKKDWLTRKEN